MWTAVSKHQGPQHSAQSLCKALSGGCTLESDNVGLALCLGVVEVSEGQVCMDLDHPAEVGGRLGADRGLVQHLGRHLRCLA